MLLAIKRGWFSSSKKIPQILTAILPPALACLWQLCNLAPYQLARIQVHLHPDEYASEGAFLLTTARRILSHLSLSGSGWKYLLENQQLPMQQLPGVSYDFIVLQIASIGGIASAALLILVLGLFYLYLTRMVIRQKNQLGQLTGIGCVMVLILETVRNLLNNFGFYTMSTGGFPFLSYGRSHTIMLYALLGVLLSIYRYQDLIWETKPARSSEGSLVLLKLGNCRLRLEWMEKPKRPEKLF
ncbi:MAG: FtsW/RodA/SpoVE family cell cycle protein [Lachnospiraceae bacterium]|nr:FtsW/RodA/SpoVE family cell cycle protein [Lachnospiraceae bacterium]